MKKLVFSTDEYKRRLDLVKERMDHRGIELLLVLDPSHMSYLTGFDGWSFYVHQGLVIDLKDPMPMWFGRAQDSNAARMTTYLPDDHIFGYKDEYVQSRYMHTMEFVAGLMKGKGHTLAVEMDGYWFNAKMLLTLNRELPQMKIVDAEHIFGGERIVFYHLYPGSRKDYRSSNDASHRFDRTGCLRKGSRCLGIRPADTRNRNLWG